MDGWLFEKNIIPENNNKGKFLISSMFVGEVRPGVPQCVGKSGGKFMKIVNFLKVENGWIVRSSKSPEMKEHNSFLTILKYISVGFADFIQVALQ